MEKNCILCNSERLYTSGKESLLIKGAKYTSCLSCGNVMIDYNNTLIPTPQDDNEMTKAMIEDAAKAFELNGAKLMAVSLTEEKNMESHMQPTTVKENMQNYVNMHIHKFDELDEDEIEEFSDFDECDCEEELIDFDDFDGNYDYLVEQPIEVEVEKEEADKELSLQVASELRTEGRDYLLVMPDGRKQVYLKCSKEFIKSIINSVGSHVQLFELNEIELKTEVTYSF